MPSIPHVNLFTDQILANILDTGAIKKFNNKKPNI